MLYQAPAGLLLYSLALLVSVRMSLLSLGHPDDWQRPWYQDANREESVTLILLLPCLPAKERVALRGPYVALISFVEWICRDQ